MTDLKEFLLARIAEDEAVAKAATLSAAVTHPGMGWNPAANDSGFAAIYAGPVDDAGYRTEEVFRFTDEMDCEECVRPSGPDLEHIARWDPARVLRKCEADRLILEEHALGPADTGEGQGCGTCIAYFDWGPAIVPGPCPTLRALALPYADHPAYREEWRV